ncbi:adenylate cyclase type 3 [Phlebotomus argentipes]|uniref:adenylate cyclase type 3 n=1 Tax=Phlebotomus argentipes TaxID=94469 RepID=UPI0028938019|nr:adenylate cyclase type 3 [Phlebotomus argentipes]XP_059613779.1 adenylate cyclase type 3 [Phlebotomus argentipes]XP_059613780.1 adenylate cyclase type 3 [Phlebotomus argentipes]XP_059613782.1 adenylate cyclase type 3 [Phlebotomus argentipes]XP_059613783.1 adenylate cyclase type 3 [Phlebotomus argentipes]XP_059613784.1 adenylate cyclase type 3 [Phlebotomus argentipes]XP_059613785.1 adenylate cyclase type 3 [Phlebotomus argentipes]
MKEEHAKSPARAKSQQNITSDILLPDSVLEKLYQNYSIKQKRSGLFCFLLTSLLFDLWAIAIPQGQTFWSLGCVCLFLLSNVILLVVLIFGGKFKDTVWRFAPYLGWTFAFLQLALHLVLKDNLIPKDSLGWVMLLNFLVYIILPVPMKYHLIFFGIATFFMYTGVIMGMAQVDAEFWRQVLVDMVLIVGATLVGLLCYHLGEIKQRRAFLEAKKSLEVKMLIEEEAAEQERLLLSVLPAHVAVKMRQDLGCTDSEQFKKIYMSRHENVSILYADIVGFTAISSTYSAQDLVKMLNELFARFDRLAEKYQQLRIKILGDCYYCICGAPVEIANHASLCVYMGLSMVKAIKYVQQKTQSPVDMRVGIHTGAVLAGILGQRQWQFDVYSKDVELANKMESSGMAGRVHISEQTFKFLNGEFEVEPAYGEKREEALRIAGLKTYFITKVLKPFVPTASEEKNGTTKLGDMVQNSLESDALSETLQEDDQPKAQTAQESHDVSPMSEDKQKEEDFKQRLQKELVSRDGHGDLSKHINILLTFRNKNHEAAYSAYREPYSSVPLLACLVVYFLGITYYPVVLPKTALHFALTLAPFLLIFPLVFISVSESFFLIFPDWLVSISRKFNDLIWLRRTATALVIILIVLTNFLAMVAFACQWDNFSGTVNATLHQPNKYRDLEMYFPSYFTNYAVLILIGTSILAQLSHVVKILFIVTSTALYCFANIFMLERELQREQTASWTADLPLRFIISAQLVAISASLSILSRHFDREDRVIFMWKIDVEEAKEKASDMRQRNEQLVYNILPVHVAAHFMGNRKRSHDDLYSQSYAEVGVLFASMPNFSDFYSEDAVNNQGLECLRFLNEVISDFDALLELPQFQDIIKIKTIGSTYMAASGLNPSRQVQPDDPIVVRWNHLALLVEFAIELKKALQGINEQSFNHFVLKMGVNHGPITAGVIGARKPHYDIWGNTVNVASRMESTGKAGAIQVTEETTHILQTFGYTFEQRGLVAVKGKGQLMTYYLQGKSAKPPPSATPVELTNGLVAPPTTQSEGAAAVVSEGMEKPETEGSKGAIKEDDSQPREILSNIINSAAAEEENLEPDARTPLLTDNNKAVIKQGDM